MWIEKLRKLKKQSKMTNEQISQASGVPISTVEKIFSGYTTDPKLETVRKVVTCMGYSLDDIDPSSQPDADLYDYLEHLRTRPELQMLFSLSKNATKEEVEQAVAIIEALQKTSRR